MVNIQTLIERTFIMAVKFHDLPYGKKDLEPHISRDTMELHHEKHYAGYVNNLNTLIAGTDFDTMELEDIVRETARKADKVGHFNNAGQTFNHNMFWKCMKPNGGGKPSGALAEKINQDFGSYDSFADAFKKAGATQFGSGWAWLVLNKETNKLGVMGTPNAENPLIHQNLVPLLACDVWEHAYYLDYQNKRPDYLTTFLDHVVNWDYVSDNFEKAA